MEDLRNNFFPAVASAEEPRGELRRKPFLRNNFLLEIFGVVEDLAKIAVSSIRGCR